METLFLNAAAPDTAEIAAKIIRDGGLVAVPTETVYGLGANGLDPEAVKKIFEAKGRPQDNPLILHISEAGEMTRYCHSIPDAAWALAEAFWPGPLTMVLPALDYVPLSTRAGLPTVAIRCPDCAITREIIRLSGVPIAAPSANISGKPSTTTAAHVLHDHDGKIAAVGADIVIPADAEVINAEGMWVTPGLIDCLFHASSDAGLEGVELSLNRIAQLVDRDVSHRESPP